MGHAGFISSTIVVPFCGSYLGSCQVINPKKELLWSLWVLRACSKGVRCALIRVLIGGILAELVIVATPSIETLPFCSSYVLKTLWGVLYPYIDSKPDSFQVRRFIYGLGCRV